MVSAAPTDLDVAQWLWAPLPGGSLSCQWQRADPQDKMHPPPQLFRAVRPPSGHQPPPLLEPASWG